MIYVCDEIASDDDDDDDLFIVQSNGHYYHRNKNVLTICSQYKAWKKYTRKWYDIDIEEWKISAGGEMCQIKKKCKQIISDDQSLIFAFSLNTHTQTQFVENFYILKRLLIS